MSNRTRLALANTEAFTSALSPFETAVLATVFATLTLATVAGNALVLLSFLLDRNLRTHTNFFLLSLASSDMLLGTIAMPLYSQYLLKGQWTLGRVPCDLWLALDYMCSTASCLNLLAISLDRYLSVTRPLKYRVRRTGKYVALMIGGVWITSFLMWPPWIWSWEYIEGGRTVPDDDCYVQFLETNFYLTMVTSILHYYLPLAFMLFLYYGIWRETRRREQYLAEIEAERHHGIAEDSRSLPKTSHKSARGCSRINRGTRKYSEAAIFGVRDPSGPERVCNDPAPFCRRLHADGKTELSQLESSVNDKIANEGDENASTKTKDVLLEDVSSSRGTDIWLDDLDHALVPLRREADDKSESTRIEPCSSARDKMESDLNEIVSDRTKCVTDISSSSRKKFSRKLWGDDKTGNKAARVLTAILLAFIVTTTPYNVIVIVRNLDSTHSLVSDTVWNVLYYLFYVNSTLNPVCYALANRNFKRTYRKILTCSWKRQRVLKITSSSDRSMQTNSTSTTLV